MSLDNIKDSGAGEALKSCKGDMKPELKGLEGLPIELLEEVTSHLDPATVGNLRGVSKLLDHMLLEAFLRKLVHDRTIYATYASLARFLGMFHVFSARALHLKVKGLCLVADGLKVPEYGYDWAWENLLQWDTEDRECTKEDLDIIYEINKQHASFYNVNNAFVNGGGYRSMLIAIFKNCPNLKVLDIRKLKPDEHIPGWVDIDKFTKLSFHCSGINTKPIFYGDWQYDTVHYRVTHYTDEFGDDIIEPNAGPQASFIDDLNAAVTASERDITVNFIRG